MWDVLTQFLAAWGSKWWHLIISSVVGVLIVYVTLDVTYPRVRERFAPQRIGNRLRKFFASDIDRVEVHDKLLPGYDLGSINRALQSYFGEYASAVQQVGALQYAATLREVLPNAGAANTIPSQPLYERLPVDVGTEESFVSNCMYFARVRVATPAVAAVHPIAVFLVHAQVSNEVWDDLETNAAPAAAVRVSVACLSKHVADAFFTELEKRRKALSIYRGKVIDPEVGAGGITSIRFRRLHPVGREDLILPDSVRALIDQSIVAFCSHEAMLRSLGIDLKRGILFVSPPGTGKTSISLYLAGSLPNFTVCFISGRKLLYPRELCAMARYLQPTMLVFEDIDLIAQERDANGLATVLGELMNQIDGAEATDQVLFIMNTNSLDRIEQAVRNRPGRVDQIIRIPLPDVESRRLLLRRFTQKVRIVEEEIEKAANSTDGATPAMLHEVVKRAIVRALTTLPPTNGEPPMLSANDLLMAFQQVQSMRADRPEHQQVL